MLKYSSLFPDKTVEFECERGWMFILDELFKTIQWYVDTQEKSQPTIDYVKQKFGGLRLGIENSDPVIMGMQTLAESMSYNICEFCGQNNSIGRNYTNSGWVHTCCSNCFKEKNLSGKWEMTRL